jgi:ubiquinone/menaquinone biosynthesis C-methylase UbiE
MTGIWVAVLGVLVLIAAAFLLFRPIRIPREPEREGYQDEEASLAYDRTSRWPIFALERHIVLSALTTQRMQGTLLDIGCGPGFLAAKVGLRFPCLKVVGLDVNAHMTSLASARLSRSRGKYNLVLGDVSSLPISPNSIDIVVSSLSLHHWKDPAAALQEVHRVLAPGGRLVIFDVRRDVPHFVYYAFMCGQALFSPRAISRTNGAVGSLWSGYTAEELEGLLAARQFEGLVVRRGLAWLVVKAVKPSN